MARIVPKLLDVTFGGTQSHGGPRLPSGLLKQVHGPQLGLLFSFIYLIYGTILLLSAYVLSRIANQNVYMGIVQEDFVKNIWSAPVTTLLHFQANSLAELSTSGPPRIGSVSLADLQYDKCENANDDACAEQYEPNTKKVIFYLGQAFALIPEFELPDFQTRQDFKVKYTSTLVGWNKPAVMFYFEDHREAVVCSVRRAEYHKNGDSADAIDRNSFAFCSRRAYDPDWFCENDVSLNTTTYVIKILKAKASYVGRTPRGELYFNPGAVANLTMGSAGNATLSAVQAADEYNSGILVGRAPWDLVPSYNCKQYNPQTTYGWLYQGQGVLFMYWRSHEMMLSYAFVLWLMTAFLFVVQYRFLRFSSIPIGPIYMAKQPIPVICLVLAVNSNYNVQVLTTFLHRNEVTAINGPFYMALGPAMMASITSIMIANVIQIAHSPRVAVPSWLVTVFSVVNWCVVFAFEIVAVPRLPLGLSNPCAYVTSTSCL